MFWKTCTCTSNRACKDAWLCTTKFNIFSVFPLTFQGFPCVHSRLTTFCTECDIMDAELFIFSYVPVNLDGYQQTCLFIPDYVSLTTERPSASLRKALRFPCSSAFIISTKDCWAILYKVVNYLPAAFLLFFQCFIKSVTVILLSSNICVFLQ